MYIKIALIAYVLDTAFGEFKFIRHPVIFIGDFISWFEKYFYQDSRLRGFLLLFGTVFIFGFISYIVHLYVSFWIEGIFSSMFLAHHMLQQSVKEVLADTNPNKSLSYLVSRDTQNLSKSDINKALIETYAENLSDGVIAPLFYLIFFGLVGIVVYKSVNTLDSMVGYKTKRYNNFGFASAKCDDILNFIPARITAFLLMVVKRRFPIKMTRTYAKGHSSPNAGYPISAMALLYEISLGGPTPYHGVMVDKPFFGNGVKNISKEKVEEVLKIAYRIDTLVIILLLSALLSM